MASAIQYRKLTTPNESFITVVFDGNEPFAASSSQPNFNEIVRLVEAAARGENVDPVYLASLFDVGKAIVQKFQRLSERITVENGNIFLDGDVIDDSLADQILDFIEKGEDFQPLVNFYEKLTTNPLGDVRKGVFDWIKGQRQEGALTITPEGDLLGYKSVTAVGNGSYRPSRVSRNGGKDGDRVNGVPVAANQYILQRPGDVVEMPRSKVLHAPSQACGDGLHIGTWTYAKGFTGDVVLLVQFSPRDIVSLPDSTASGKLRVNRYTVVKPVTKPLDTPLYMTTETAKAATKVQEKPDVTFDDTKPIKVGSRVIDLDGDKGTVAATSAKRATVKYDDFDLFGQQSVATRDLKLTR